MKKGIKHNRKFNFYAVYIKYNLKNKGDIVEYFTTKEDAEVRLKTI